MVSTPMKNMKVNWDDDIPNIWKKWKIFQVMFQSPPATWGMLHGWVIQGGAPPVTSWFINHICV